MQRRDFLRIGAGGLLGALGMRWLAPVRALAKAPPAKAKAMILLWLNGGPSHIDTFDPKPGAATGGPWKAIATRAPAIQLAEHLPKLAEQAHHLCLLRGMTSKEGNHQRAIHLLHTGYPPNPTVAAPSLGAWVSEELAERAAELPAFVSIAGPSAGAGFLGAQHGPFVVTDPGRPPEDTDYPRDVDSVRFLRRKAALAFLEDRFAAETGDRQVAGRRAVYDKAVRMMYAPKLKAFELGDEPDAVKAAYGDHDFGRGCLLARRLVEAGVRYVEVTLDGWDTHQNNFQRVAALSAQLDGAFATLVAELDARKLLDTTLVACFGEFGRTPKINAADGRDHFPQAWSAALAGGGVRGGIVQGATDGAGATVVEKPTTVPDLFATIAAQLGIDPDKSFDTPNGRPISITQNGTPIRDIVA